MSTRLLTETMLGYAVLVDGKHSSFFASAGNPGVGRAVFSKYKEATAYAKQLREHGMKCRAVKVEVSIKQVVRCGS